MLGPEIGRLRTTADGQSLRIDPAPQGLEREGVLALKADATLVFVADTRLDYFLAYPPRQAFDHLHSGGQIAVHFRPMPDGMDRGFTAHEIISRRNLAWNPKRRSWT